MSTVPRSPARGPGATAQIAVVTGDPALAFDVESACRMLGLGHARLRALDGPEFASSVALFDALLVDTRLVVDRGADTLSRLLVQDGAAPVLLLADASSDPEVFSWLERGVSDVLSRPPHIAELRPRLARALESREFRVHFATLEDELTQRSRQSFEDRAMVARSESMKSLVATLERVAPMRTTVLVSGESGTGKELVARSVHFRSPRADGPFIAINCAALPPHLIESDLFGHEKGAFTGAVSRRAGKFELAHGGTLFLDEIGETDLATQAKLLRVLEEQEFMRVGGSRAIRVDVRLVTATNRDLEELVADGRFREDLFYRLNVVTLRVPPLRDRREDLPALVDAFLEHFCQANRLPRRHIAPAAMDAFLAHSWPGNVRELQNTIEALVVSTPRETLDLEDLPSSVLRRSPRTDQRPGSLAGRPLADIEADAIRETLTLVSGSRTEAARMLGIGIRTLRRRLGELDLDETLAPRPGRPPRRDRHPSR